MARAEAMACTGPPDTTLFMIGVRPKPIETPASRPTDALLPWCRSPALSATRSLGSTPEPCSSRHDSAQ